MKTTKSLYRFRAFAWALLSAIAFATVSCSKDDEPAMTSQSITDIVNTNSDFTILRAAVQRAGLGTALQSGSLTVFAPTDAAFQAAGFADAAAINAVADTTLRNILQYHVVGSKVESSAINFGNNAAVNSLLTNNGTLYVTKDNSGVSVNGARVTQADVMASNGVVHVIDKVLMPPTGNLVQVITSQPQNFSLLAAAATRAGTALLTALSSSTAAVTVFAPTNAAFLAAGLDAAAIQQATPAQLTTILTYHAVPGRVFATNLASGTVTTLQSGTVTVNVGANTVSILGAGNNGTAANVTRANVMATNGVIHVIDRVLLPAQ
ncbi:fasciclin domain-containing protein [Arsenicibacter rosenii]|uniref:FAS1 domain-containing protein n=1 Tax=Arsenicibacter rosenii TaxID=1750698 RepID=A0A1S2VFM6_9BACT|nr:fasciclin domain-containing protein [Arsenicibacter rosenii]OIN57514.1 hypothetical protein BLX24_19680 [Arsenicibacter rosenii]